MSDVVALQGKDIMRQYELSVPDVKNQVNLIQHLMREVMQEGTHFGKIPGSEKPSLFKPGAEKIAFTFRFSRKIDVNYRELQNGHREYQCTVALTHIPTGTYIGEGIGMCSTMESKYRYRNQSGFDVMDEPIPDDYKQKKTVYRNQGYGAKLVDGRWVWVKYTSAERVENPDIADVYNTVLKMATKRGFSDAILSSTAASDIFTQDLEDDPDLVENAPPPPPPPPPKMTAEFVARQASLYKKLDALKKDGVLNAEELGISKDYLGNATRLETLEKAWVILQGRIDEKRTERQEEVTPEAEDAEVIAEAEEEQELF